MTIHFVTKCTFYLLDSMGLGWAVRTVITPVPGVKGLMHPSVHTCSVAKALLIGSWRPRCNLHAEGGQGVDWVTGSTHHR